MKNTILVLILLSTGSVFAKNERLEILGCDFSIENLRKEGTHQTSSHWNQSFEVDNAGWGFPMTEQLNSWGGESHLGKVDLDKTGTKLEVLIESNRNNNMTVKAIIKKVDGDYSEIIAEGIGFKQATEADIRTKVFAKVKIESSLIKNLRSTDKVLENPMDSDFFPNDQWVLGSAEIVCSAVFIEP